MYLREKRGRAAPGARGTPRAPAPREGGILGPPSAGGNLPLADPELQLPLPLGGHPLKLVADALLFNNVKHLGKPYIPLLQLRA